MDEFIREKKQKTIKNKIYIEGIGLHSGKTAKMEIHPADVDTGINFLRSDVSPHELIKGDYRSVQNTMLATSLVHNGIEIKTVEHLLASLSGLHIDNVLIKISGSEIPILDGSSEVFTREILKSGIVEQDKPRKYLLVKKEISVYLNDSYSKFIPYDGSVFKFRISYGNKVIDNTPNFAKFDLINDKFEEKISLARTFGFEHEINHLQKEDLIKGGSLDNAIVVSKNEILNESGLRIDDEFVIHKILDAIGDIYLSGYPIIGLYDGYKSGHRLNNMLLRKLMADEDNYEIITFS